MYGDKTWNRLSLFTSILTIHERVLWGPRKISKANNVVEVSTFLYDEGFLKCLTE